MAYSNSVIRRAEEILGYGITSIPGDRTYTVIDGVIYTDLFTGPVTIPGYAGGFTRAYNGKVNGLEYYNEIVLHKPNKCQQTVTLDLDWGSECFKNDINDLLEWLEDTPSTDDLDNAGIASKRIEDFSVSYRSGSDTGQDTYDALVRGWGYYIRRPSMVDVAGEQRDAARYF